MPGLRQHFLPLFLIYWASFLYSLVFLAWKLRERKLKQATILAGFSLIAIFPLLFVWPVGYRCLFHSYVFLMGTILIQTEYVLTECVKTESRMIQSVVGIVLVITIVCQCAVFTDIRKICVIRDQIIAEMAKGGQDVV